MLFTRCTWRPVRTLYSDATTPSSTLPKCMRSRASSFGSASSARPVLSSHNCSGVRYGDRPSRAAMSLPPTPDFLWARKTHLFMPAPGENRARSCGAPHCHHHDRHDRPGGRRQSERYPGVERPRPAAIVVGAEVGRRFGGHARGTCAALIAVARTRRAAPRDLLRELGVGGVD